jgi:sporulation protein YlmC with PRC-barrel domain
MCFAAGTAHAQQKSDCVELRGTSGEINADCGDANPEPVADGKSDRAKGSGNAAGSDAPTGSLPAGKTDRGGSRLLASELIGQTVRANDGTDAGTVVDVVMAPSLDGLSLVLRIGGILGVGGRDIAVPAEQVAIAKDNAGLVRLTVAATMEQLQRAPVFDRTALMR